MRNPNTTMRCDRGLSGLSCNRRVIRDVSAIPPDAAIDA
jgi:hypothetical protein